MHRDGELDGASSAGDNALALRPVILRPRKPFEVADLVELYHFRELAFFFAWRDVKVRYKQTAFGVAWAVLQPVFMMAVFSLFFGRLAGIPSNGVPYPLFVFAGLVPWVLFTTALTQSSNSLVENANLLSKSYFPRLVLPIASTLAGVVDFGIALAVVAVLLTVFGHAPTLAVLTLPALALLALATALSVGIGLSALNARYRDVRYTLPFIAQLWLFATPIAYPTSLVPERWRPLYALNPMVGVIDAFRWALVGTPPPSPAVLGASTAAVVVLLIGAVGYFKRHERNLADIV